MSLQIPANMTNPMSAKQRLAWLRDQQSQKKLQLEAAVLKKSHPPAAPSSNTSVSKSQTSSDILYRQEAPLNRQVDAPARDEQAPASNEAISTLAPRKRKFEGEGGNQRPPPALRNFDCACYQNSSLQVLHQMPEYAGLSSGREVIESHLDSDLVDRAAKKGRNGAKARKEVAAKVQDMKAAGSLELSDIFASVMQQMSSGEGPVNPIIFNLACGAFFDKSFNGTEQLCAAEFLERLFPVLEQNHSDLHDLRKLEIEQRKKCKNCGTIKTLVDNDFVLTIPEDKRKGRQTVSIEDLFRSALSTPADCKDLRCGECSQTGEWEEVEGWQAVHTRQLKTAPKYLAARVQREDFQISAGGVCTIVKYQTKIDLTCRKLKWHTSNGSKARYELFAAVEHAGSGTGRGHYTALRKLDECWYNCDDVSRSGVQKLTEEELKEHGQAKVCFLRRV